MSTPKSFRPEIAVASLIRILRNVWRNPARDWVILFLTVQFLFQLDGGNNERSRWAMLAAIVEDRTVQIDNYWYHTIDWAQTPDKHYYSNKAPGPMLIGLPLFWHLDQETSAFSISRAERDARRVEARPSVMHDLSFTMQSVPFALVVLWVIRTLQKRRVPLAALHLVSVALLFGNTAALLMGTYFGHSMAAMFALAGLMALHYRRYGQAGLCLGLAMLCDYGAAVLLVPAGIVLLWEHGRRFRRIGWFAAGGLVPGAVWCWYHQRCFGSPLVLPNKFQNPLFVDAPQPSSARLWGAFNPIPNTDVLQQLLFGKARGLLYTQGWVLVSLVAGLVVLGLQFRGSRFAARDRLFRESSIFAFVGLGLLFVFNCSFNGWHGGWAPGPRYLSSALPCCALAAGLIYARSPAFFRQLMVVFVVFSTVLFLLTYGNRNVLIPEDALFEHVLEELMRPGKINLARTLYLALPLGWVGYRAMRSVINSPAGD